MDDPEQVEVNAGAVGHEVYIEIGEQDCRFTPEDARKLAFALMFAADEAEHGSASRAE